MEGHLKSSAARIRSNASEGGALDVVVDLVSCLLEGLLEFLL